MMDWMMDEMITREEVFTSGPLLMDEPRMGNTKILLGLEWKVFGVHYRREFINAKV